MSRVLGVLNHKGGTGKTTTVLNLGAGLAMRGKRVLCIDLDAQGALATCLGVDYTYSLTHLLLKQVRPQTCIVHARENLDLIPSDRSLLEAEGDLWRSEDNWQARRRLLERMDGMEANYDYVLLDFSPSVSLVGESGLMFVQQLIVPVEMTYMALVGTRQVIRTLRTTGQLPGYNVPIYLIVPTFYRRRQRKDREVMDVLTKYFSDKLADPIRADVRVAEAPSYGKSIFEYAPRCAGAKDYMRLVERVLSDG
ncbi:MAG: ParA family protein [Anaerolineae bacterium]|nr:ParA family protein [Anaerolineae bacterium]